jgi:hypothetical protein
MPDFGEWLPDLPPFGHSGLVTARNVYPTSMGYRSVSALSAVTVDALADAWRGGGSFIGADGTTALLAGTDTGLYSYASGAWSAEVAAAYSANWQFAQFGAFVVCVNGETPLKYTITTSTGATLGGSPPDATMVAVVRDFVFLAGDPAANSMVSWSAINNAEGWTVGTDQSDEQILPDGGPITGLAGGEYGLVFQDQAIHRFSYVGAPLIFQRDKVSESVGAIAPGAVAQFGRMAFFLSGRGFYAFADGDLQPIGREKVDRTFWASYERADVVSNIRSAVDPARSLVMWSMPGRLWVYNWDLMRWADFDLPGTVGLSTGVNIAVSLEDVDTLYPDTGSGNVDDVPYSLDDPIFQGGAPLLTVAKDDGNIYAFSAGNPLQATVQMPLLEMVPGRDARVRRCRLIGDPVDAVTLTIGQSQRLGDAQAEADTQTITASGDMPIRVRGRYLQPKFTVSGDATAWAYLRGYEVALAAGAKR